LYRYSVYVVAFIFCLTGSSSASPLQEVWKDSVFNGYIRSYYQTRELKTPNDVEVYSLGTKFNFETGSFYGLQGGTSFFIANDLGANRDDIKSQNFLLPVSELNTFGTAYLKYSRHQTEITLGRQTVDTPFINPSNAFIVPVTYFGYTLSNSSLKSVTFDLMHLEKIKLRQETLFQDTGNFLTDRLGVQREQTNGTTVAGMTWNHKKDKFQVWNYYLPELFNMVYFQADVTLPSVGDLQPFLSFQYGKQFDVGDKLLGTVNAQVFGANLGFGWKDFKLAYAVNYLPKKSGTFRNGGFLSPYSFATDALYTNSLDGGMTLKDSAFIGLGHKWTVNYTPTNFLIEFSYTIYDMTKSVGGRDSNEVNFDITYSFQDWLKGFSLRNRTAWVVAELEREDLIENRLQLQYVFDLSVD
jgi:hypothetical protein